MYGLFDIGGTHMRVGRVAEDGKMEYEKVPTPANYDEGITKLVEVLARVAKTAPLKKVGGGIAGTLDPARETLLKAYHLPGWANRNPKKDIEGKLHIPTLVENDAALGALGEAVYGAGKGYTIVAYLTIGTGIGGARVVNGRIDENTYGFEPGHQIIDLDKNLVPQAGYGSLEDYASGDAIYKHFNKKAEDITDPATWDKIAGYLAAGVHNASVFWSPEVIVIGGSGIKTPNLLSLIEKHLTVRTQVLPEYPDIKFSELGDASTLWGAHALLSL